MEDINNMINIDVNENHPTVDIHKTNDNVSNESAKNKHLTDESVAFLQNSPVTEKQVLTSVNNNFQNGRPNNAEENNVFLMSESGTTKADSINSSSLVNETELSTNTSNSISDKSLHGNSGSENECKSDPFIKSTNSSLNEIPVGNVSFLSDASSDILYDNQKNLSNSATQCNETSISKLENIDSISMGTEKLKDTINNFNMLAQDLVDFSFREKENVTNDLLGSFTAIDSTSKQPETSPNNALQEVFVNIQDKPQNTSAGVVEIDCAIQVPKNPTTDNFKDSALTDAPENCTVVMEHSTNTDSLLGVSASPTKEAASKIITDGNTSVELEKPNKATEEISEIDSCKLDTSSVTKDSAFLGDSTNTDFLPEESKSSAKEAVSIITNTDNTPVELEKPSKATEQVSTFDSCKLDISDVKENCVVLVDSISTLSSLKLYENSKNEACDDIPAVNTSIGLETSSKSTEEVPVVDPGKLDILADKDFLCKRDSSVDETSFQVPKSSPTSEPDELSPLKLGNISFGMSENPCEQFSDFGFKIPEVPPNNSCEQFSDSDFGFKIPEVPPNNSSGDSDFSFKMPENSLVNEGDEQFVDAVQFFKDPNSIQFLESIRTSTIQPGSSVIPRSSLYVNFDPLHSKLQTNGPRPDNCALISAALQENNASVEKCSPEVVNKNLVDVATRESLGNILISFDSPKSSTSVDLKNQSQALSPPKMFTEEEVQHKLKIHELEIQEAYLKNQREMENEIAWRDKLMRSQRNLIEEFTGIAAKLSEEFSKGQEKIVSLETENEKLKEDIKTSAEDLQSVENTFTDFYKRYEQCKGMLKTYKDNEEHLKQTNVDMQTKLKEQEQMYHVLQERTEEMLEKANLEVDSAKRSGEAQLTVLKAQLKKAEMKISSLESDNKQIKLENSQLGGICDDLMAKVGRS